jgi:GT2 family glycosyltransferase
MSIVRATAMIVAYDGGDGLVGCVQHLLESRYSRLQVLVVDNASTDGSIERVERIRDPRVRVLRLPSNDGFACGVNAGMGFLAREHARHPDQVVVLVNQDCFVREDAVGALLARVVSDERIGVVGARILDLDGCTVQHAGGSIRDNGLTEHFGRGFPDCMLFWKARDVEYVTGALFAFRASTWRRIGPFDEAYRPVYFEEVDFCVRVRRARMRVVYEPASVALHSEGASSGGTASATFLRRYHRNRIRFLASHRLRRGTWARTLAAEVKWLSAQRRAADIWPVLLAYTGLPLDLARRRRRAMGYAR